MSFAKFSALKKSALGEPAAKPLPWSKHLADELLSISLWPPRPLDAEQKERVRLAIGDMAAAEAAFDSAASLSPEGLRALVAVDSHLSYCAAKAWTGSSLEDAQEHAQILERFYELSPIAPSFAALWALADGVASTAWPKPALERFHALCARGQAMIDRDDGAMSIEDQFKTVDALVLAGRLVHHATPDRVKEFRESRMAWRARQRLPFSSRPLGADDLAWVELQWANAPPSDGWRHSSHPDLPPATPYLLDLACRRLFLHIGPAALPLIDELRLARPEEAALTGLLEKAESRREALAQAGASARLRGPGRKR